jgi:ribulose-phosphate 3-epimerase
MVRIAPSILSSNFLRLEEEIKAAEEAGADFIHIDVMDGHFVPNITIGPFIVEAARRATGLPLDVHLMIENPDRYINDFAAAGADYLVVHEEASVHLHRTVQHIKEKGVKAGVSINPATPINTLDHVLEDLDLVLLMSVNPGFGGQSYIPGSTAKVRAMRNKLDELSLSALLEVDGGIKPSNAKEVVEAGADILVMGSAFFGADDYSKVVMQVRESAGSA